MGKGNSALTRTKTGFREELRVATVSHVADFCHRYPGEIVTLFTCVEVQKPLPDLTLRVSLPKTLALENYEAPPELEGIVPAIETDQRVDHLVWSFQGELPAGTRYEYQVRARVAPMDRDASLESRATGTSSKYGILGEETATVAIWAKGRYLRHLPEIFEQDELMGRFLMLFESFWAPIETQIDNVRRYLDPEMTPEGFLPWLASWVGLDLDGRLSKERQRQLIRQAVSLYRRRGTKQALREHLELYTGGQVQIIEHRARDFCLGPDARLGPGIALGRDNVPHTFTVIAHLPPVSPGAEGKHQHTWEEVERHRAIEEIIEAERPAHTGYNLVIRDM